MKLSLKISGGFAGMAIVGEVDSNVVPLSVSSDVNGKLLGLTQKAEPPSPSINDGETFKINFATKDGDREIEVDLPSSDNELDAILSCLKNEVLKNKRLKKE